MFAHAAGTGGFHLGQGAPGCPWPQVHPCSQPQLQQHSHPPWLGGFTQTFHVSLPGVCNMPRVFFKGKKQEKIIFKITWKEYFVANSVREWLGSSCLRNISSAHLCCLFSSFPHPFREQHGQQLRSSVWRIMMFPGYSCNPDKNS